MRIATSLLFVAAVHGQALDSDWRAALNRIRPDSLRGHLSFLASDLLEGRDTPSRGQAIAAEYIASRFRAAGLEPGGNNGYFHDTPYLMKETKLDGFYLRIAAGGKTYVVPAAQVSVNSNKPVEFFDIPATLIHLDNPGDPPAVPEGGIVIVTLNPDTPAMKAFGALASIQKARPAVILYMDLRFPTSRTRIMAEGVKGRAFPISTVTVTDAEVAKAAREWTSAEVTLRMGGAEDQPFPLRNVVGILRGSDPVLRDSYVFVNAHYDHIGWLGPGAGDRVNNGANDDGSGTSVLIEMAESLARLTRRPKRSIVFLAVSGEEKGLLGSRAYLRSPTVPLDKIVADLALEHLGRTDTREGDQTNRLNVTGFDFSEVTGYLVEAGKQTGVEVTKNTQYSDQFFKQSDNYSFADKNIPAHGVSSGYLFPEYHAPGDEWEKINFDHMARVGRTIALSLLRLGDSEVAPKWLPAYKR